MPSFLLIDEDRNFREALAIALRLEGCEVTSAGSTDAARVALATARYDLCVVDLHLAGAEALLAEVLGGPLPVLLTGPHADLLASAAVRFPRARVQEKPLRARDLLALARLAA
jgi:DNA-binding NtrC family response regulator